MPDLLLALAEQQQLRPLEDGNGGWKGAGEVGQSGLAQSSPKLPLEHCQQILMNILPVHCEVSTDFPLLNLRSSFFIHIPQRNNILGLCLMVLICRQDTKEISNNRLFPISSRPRRQLRNAFMLCIEYLMEVGHFKF